MNIALADASALATAETLILPLFADRPADLSGPLEALAQTPGLAETAAKFKETCLLYTLPGAPCRRLLTVGLGDAAEFSAERLSRALAVAARVARDRLCERVGVLLAGSPQTEGVDAARVVREAAVALRLGLYAFTLLKTTDDAPADPAEFLLATDESAPREELSAALALGLAEAEGVCLARDLVNRPSNHARRLKSSPPETWCDTSTVPLALSTGPPNPTPMASGAAPERSRSAGTASSNQARICAGPASRAVCPRCRDTSSPSRVPSAACNFVPPISTPR